MDLFSLVAKLTLDDTDYESAIQSAEGKGKNAQLDASGDIKAEDKYSEEIGKAEKQVDDFDKKEATADIKVDTEDATKNTTSFEGVFRESVGKMGAALTAAGIAAGVKKIADEFAAALDNAAKYADQVDKGSRELSMSTQAYQEWRYALQASGADIGTITKGWKSLTSIVADGSLANAGEDIQGAFEALQIDPSQYKTTEALFDAVIDGLASMEAGSERDSLVNAIFGPGGTKLNALLDSGVSGIDGLIKRAHELKLVMSEGNVLEGTAFGDAMTDMNLAVEALKQNIVAGLFPLLTDAANTIAGIVAFFNGRTDANTLAEQFDKIDHAMNRAFVDADVNEETTNSLIKELKDLSTETGTCKGNLDEWRKIAEKLIEICPSLAEQINTVTGEFTEQTGSLEDNAKAWFKNVRTQAIVSATQSKQRALAERAQELVDMRTDAKVAYKEYEAYDKQQREKLIPVMEKIIAENPQFTIPKGYESVADWINDPKTDLWKTIQFFRGSGLIGDEDYATLQYLDVGAMQALKEYLDLQSKITTLEADYEQATTKFQLYVETADEMMQELTGGMEQTEGSAQSATEAVEGLDQAIEDLPDSKTVTVEVNTVRNGGSIFDLFGLPFSNKFWNNQDKPTPKVHGVGAKGFYDVPFDNFSALLHRDEMVLTASQARRYREGGNDSAELAAAIRELRADMTNLQIVVGQKTFGRTVVKYGGKRLGGYLGGAEDRVAAGYGWG